MKVQLTLSYNHLHFHIYIYNSSPHVLSWSHERAHLTETTHGMEALTPSERQVVTDKAIENEYKT